jgi:hypothetical protein
VSYALVSRPRRRRSLGADPDPLCTDPNSWKDSATCSETGCKTGYAATVGGDCVLVTGTGAGAVASQAGPAACAAAGGTWDGSVCKSAPVDEDSGEGFRWPWEESTQSGGGSPGGSAFEAGKPTLAGIAKGAAPWVVGAAVGIALLVHYARPS